MLGGWDGSVASPHLLLLCLCKRSCPRRGGCVAPQSRWHPSLFSLFTPLLGFILSHGFNPYFIPLPACGESGLQRAPKPRRWYWARLALSLLGKYTGVLLGIARSVSVEEGCEETACEFTLVPTSQDRHRWVSLEYMGESWVLRIRQSLNYF